MVRLAGEADRKVKEVMGQKQQAPIDQETINTVMMINESLSKVEKLDKPNCLLQKSRIESYLLEGESRTIGKAFLELLSQYPSFIDAYIEYWKYLKFRLNHKQHAKTSE